MQKTTTDLSTEDDVKLHQNMTFELGLLALLFLSACNVSRILLADPDQFEGNTNPAVSLPGLPDGDRAENTEDLTVETIEEIEGQSLRMTGLIDFIPATHDEPDEYRVSWSGFRTQVGNTTNTTVTFLDESDHVALRVVFDGTTDDLELEAGEPVPNQEYDSVTHSFLIIMRPSIGRFDFEFEQNDCADVNDCVDVGGLDFLDTDFGTLDRVRVEGGEYYLDDLSVLVEPPQ